MTRTVTQVALAICLLVGATGCGENSGPPHLKVYPVSGTLTVNGKPIFGIQVVLNSTDPGAEGRPSPRGVTEANGAFKVTTYSLGDGAPAGNYVVTTSKSNVGGPAVVQIVGRYTSQSSPVAKVTIKEAENNVLDPIDLKGK